MKRATAVLSVKFNSSHSQEKLMQVCNEDLNVFRDVPGLIEKYYIAEETTGAISGIYLFETKSSRGAFWTSELAAKIPERYGVIPETLRVEEYDMAIVLNETVLS
ncbi:YdhR family protein [Ulvibacterium sp.]|uniref:YdhR family protein n=1 Tax=Ulvibacterium sp. TaxID=2665914 RepID=UPI003CC63DA8